METLDPLTRSGFLAIAASHGREMAHDNRIAALQALVERDKGFRWFSVKWERALQHAIFERDWERDHPEDAEMLRAFYSHLY